MKRLYIGRHAKSDWDYAGIHDIDRHLTERGISDAYLMANCFVKDKREMPEIIYSSPANRAIHTAIIFSRVTAYKSNKIVMNANLYAATEQQLLNEITKLDDKYKCVMLFGHNDGLTQLVNSLTNKFTETLPTAAIACIDFKITHWNEVENNNGELQFLYRPKEFKNE